MSDIIPNLEDMTDAEKKAALDAIQLSIAKSKEVQKQRIGENVNLVIDALKKIEADIQSRYDLVGNTLEKRVASIKDGKDGKDGRDGKNGKDGRDGKQGVQGVKGENGRDGRDGVDGVDGIGVSFARIDFDGSLVIGLSSGVELNVGEVVAPDLAERIKVITNGGGTSQSVLDTLASLQTQITNLIPSQTGNSGKFLTTNGTSTSWASVAGGLSYQGTWNASTNTPTLTSSVGVNGYYYIVSTAGSTNLNGITDWQIGDWLLFNGSVWQKIDQSNLVTSVNGQTGAVSVGTVTSVAATAGTGITVTGSPITSSGTLTITNSAPDQTVALTQGGTTTITGTYPNFTISSADQFQGTVTSVTGTSPVASSGGATPAISLSAGYGDTLNPYASKTANYVLAAPNGSAGVPTFRAVVAADIPTLNQNTTGTASNVTGTVAIANGGTGLTSFTASQIHYGSFSTSANLTFNGTTLTTANDASISGLTVGKGGGAVSTNTAHGVSALVNNTTAGRNTAIGYQAGLFNTTGHITAVGALVLSANTTGTGNTAIGGNDEAVSAALQANTTGNNNIAVGTGTLQVNTTGSNNVALGYSSLYANTTASNNTAVGYQAGYSQTTSPDNVFMGNKAGYSTSTGSGSNTFIGQQAGYSHTTGQNNQFFGGGAGYYISTGSKNTVIGAYSGNQGSLDIRTASNYIVLSDGDGNPRAYINNNGLFTSIGSTASNYNHYLANSSATAPSGLVYELSGASPNNTTSYFFKGVDSTTNKIFIYSNGTVSNATGTYNTISDAKLKENIVDATTKLDKLMDVKVRNYNLIGDELKQIGFVAQELETVFPSLVYDAPDLDREGNDLGTVTKGVKLTVMIPILVKAIQELKAEFDAYKATHP